MTKSLSAPWRRSEGSAIFTAPDKYRPVRERLSRQDFRRRALRNDLAAALARSGSHIDQIIRRAHRFRIMLDDEDRVAGIAQLFQQIR